MDENKFQEGGPAFPTVLSVDGKGVSGFCGMSALDYFAASAMSGLLANPGWNAASLAGEGVTTSNDVTRVMAKMAYSYAAAAVEEKKRHG